MAWRGWRRFRPHKGIAPEFHKNNQKASALLQTLLDKTPGAVKAQRSMDAHPGTYHADQKDRLYELIDFNDTFVSLALTLSPQERQGFVERLRVSMRLYCKKLKQPTFSDEQYDAITRGLSREVAVYLGAKQQGFDVTMTSRREDAMGVHMIIADPSSGRSLNVDCKTASAYHYRIKDLVQQGRMTKREGERAEEVGFAHEVNGKGGEAVTVTLLRIDPNEVGDIRDFEFTEPDKLGEKLRRIFAGA